MPVADDCPRCGRPLPEDAPRGLCPACLLGAALDTPGDSTVEMTPRLPPEPAPRPPAAPGVVRYFGDYALVRRLGRGGMGEVWLARQESLDGRPVAVKLLLGGGGQDRARFRREAEAIAALDHPHLVEIYEVGEHEGQPYYSMKLYAGGSLQSRLAELRADPRGVARAVAAVARAVHHAHQRAILHRDLKPSNVLLDERGEPHVADFGLARRLDDEAGLTATGAVLGTPAYMAPEQASGRRGAVTTAGDVYGIGAILYELLTGHAPHEGDSVFETLELVRTADPPRPRSVDPRVDRDLETICLKCLAREHRRRYTSAEAVAEDLENWLTHRPIAARPVGRLERAALLARRRPTAAALVAVSLAAVATVLGLGARDLRRGRDTIAAITRERDRARDAEKAATAAGELARREATDNRRRLVRSAVANGNRLMDDGNTLLALPWFVHALKNEPDGPLAEHRHRIRIRALLADVPPLAHLELAPIDAISSGLVRSVGPPPEGPVLPEDQEVRHRVDSPDGSRSLIVTGPRHDTPQQDRGGYAFLWDTRSKRLAFPPIRHEYRVVHGMFQDEGRRFLTVMEVELGPDDYGRQRPVWSEVRAWGAESGEPTGDRGTLPLGRVSIEPVPGGRRLFLRGHPMTASHSSGSLQSQVWDATTLRPVLPRPDQVLGPAAASPDGKRLVAVDTKAGNNVAWVMDPETGDAIGPVDHDVGIEEVSYSPDGAAIVTSGGGRVRFWEAGNGRGAPPLWGQSFVAFSPDGRLFLTLTEQGAPRLWQSNGVPNVAEAPSPATPPLPAAGWSPTMRYVGNYASAAPVGLWARFGAAGREIHVTSRNQAANALEERRWVVADAVPPDVVLDDQGIVVPDMERYATYRLAPRGRSAGPTEIRPERLMYVRPPEEVIAPDGRTFLRWDPPPEPSTARWTLGLHATETGERIAVSPTIDATAIAAHYAPGGRTVIVLSTSAPDSYSFSLERLLHENGAPNLSEISNVCVRVLDVTSLRPIAPPFPLPARVGTLALRPDGRRLAFSRPGSAPHQLDEVVVIDLVSGGDASHPFRLDPEQMSRGPIRWVGPLDFSPDGRVLLVRPPSGPTSYYAGQFEHHPAYLLDAETLRPACPPLRIRRSEPASSIQTQAPDARVAERKAAFSPDGRLVAFGDGGNAVGLFDTATGTPVGRTLTHPGRIQWIAFRPDGRRLATAGLDGTVRLWDADTGMSVGPPMLHRGGALQVAFSPDGSFLFSSGWDAFLRVWDAERGDPIAPGIHLFFRPQDFAPGLDRVVINSRLIWDLPAERRPIEILEGLATILSAHVIDLGEGLSPATADQIRGALEALKGGDAAPFGGPMKPAESAADGDVGPR